MSNSHDNFNPFEQMTFTNDRCFLCGEILHDNNRTVEHVFPKWLQHKYNLWDKKLQLLNQSLFRYRQLTIPCCKECNQALNNKIEVPVCNAVNLGYKGVADLDQRVLFLWLNKIAYGILFRELSLRVDIKDPKSESIYSAENLKKHQMQFIFLRSAILDAEFIYNPWSILLFRLDSRKHEKYWSFNSPFLKCFFIRVDDVGIIANLMDNGIQQEYFMEYEDMRSLLGEILHPLQFAELCAKILYKTSLFFRTPYYTIIFDNEKSPKTIISHPIGGDAFDTWDQKHYASILAEFIKPWKIPVKDFYQGDDQVITYLRNNDGTFMQMIE